jgi:hypothetical protein
MLKILQRFFKIKKKIRNSFLKSTDTKEKYYDIY